MTTRERQYEYSIIIPHYNIPTLLRRCLDSIPLRDDVQVIVVDDHSKEENIQVLEELENDYPSVLFVYMKMNGGGGKARNIGLSHASGRFVLFADADDFFNDCLNDILDDYKNSDFDIVFFKGNSVDTDSFEPANRADHLNRYVDDYLSGTDPEGLHLRYKFGEPWARMVKLSVINENNISFDETLIHNDTAYSYKVGYYGKIMMADPRPIYCITVRKGSVSRASSIDRILTRVEIFGNAWLFFKEHKINVKQNRHFEELLIQISHRHFPVFRDCYCKLRSIGISHSAIIKGMLSSAYDIVLKRN